jgi:hypothetical protein
MIIKIVAIYIGALIIKGSIMVKILTSCFSSVLNLPYNT